MRYYLLCLCCACLDAPTGPREPDTRELADTLDRAIISAGIDPVKPEVAACASGTPGIVKVHVWVASAGDVTSAKIVQTPDPALGNCVAAAVKHSSYDQTAHGGSFIYPFVF